MAESILLHFRSADWASLQTVLQPLLSQGGEWTDNHQWWAYPAGCEYVVLVYPDDHCLSEYEDAAVDELVAALGDLPQSSLGIKLRRTRQEQACEVAASLTVLLLGRFEGVVDDTCGGIWTLDQIQRGDRKPHGGFLECYRLPEDITGGR